MENQKELTNNKKRIGIDRFTLKMIAVLSMICSHSYICLGLSYDWRFLNVIGRLAFPIYCYLLIEGFYHTRDVNRYLKRLILFAFISELPFDLAIYGRIVYSGHQNVFFTLAIGLFIVKCLSLEKSMAAKVLYIFAGMYGAQLLSCDYGMFGIITIVLCYYFYHNKEKNLLVLGVNQLLVSQAFYSSMQSAAALAVIPLYAYNGQNGRKAKWFFYMFYPVHFLILFFVKIIML